MFSAMNNVERSYNLRLWLTPIGLQFRISVSKSLNFTECVHPVARAAALETDELYNSFFISLLFRCSEISILDETHTHSKHGMTFSFTLSIPAAVVARRKYFIEVNLGMTGHMSGKHDHACGQLLTVRRLATIKDDAVHSIGGMELLPHGIDWGICHSGSV